MLGHNPNPDCHNVYLKLGAAATSGQRWRRPAPPTVSACFTITTSKHGAAPSPTINIECFANNQEIGPESLAPICRTTRILCRNPMRNSAPAPSRLARSYHHLELTLCRYDFEYEEDDDEDSGDVDIENKYYSAKQLKLSNPEEAIEEFLGMPALEQEKSEWGFKGLKQAIKLEFKLGRYDSVSMLALQCWSSVLIITPGRRSF